MFENSEGSRGLFTNRGITISVFRCPTRVCGIFFFFVREISKQKCVARGQMLRRVRPAVCGRHLIVTIFRWQGARIAPPPHPSPDMIVHIRDGGGWAHTTVLPARAPLFVSGQELRLCPRTAAACNRYIARAPVYDVPKHYYNNDIIKQCRRRLLVHSLY